MMFKKNLKNVSRSFYLSLRFLPSTVREQLSLAYLLARITDTIADTTTIPLNVRVDSLLLVNEILDHLHEHASMSALQQSLISHLSNDPECELIKNSPLYFKALALTPPRDAILINAVLKNIIQGQLYDLRVFNDPKAVKICSSINDLDQYLYLVAGCVGEFWTKICLNHIKNYTTSHPDDLLEKAIHFGKGLQLTNILRDMPCDLNAGRLYLPIQNHPVRELSIIEAQQHILNHPKAWSYWHRQAHAYLDDALLYTRAISDRRIRFSCFLPIDIARKTLAQLEDTSYLLSSTPVKISKKELYASLFNSFLTSWSLDFGHF